MSAVLVTLILALCACGSAAPDGSRESFRVTPGGSSAATPTSQATSGQRATPNRATSNADPQAYVRFTPLTVTDPAAEGTAAFSLLVPARWQAQGSVEWMPDWERLAYLQTSVTDPSTGITIEWLPIQDFIWFDANGFTAPIGGNYQGKAYVPPITDPAQFVSSFWVPNILGHLRGASPGSDDRTDVAIDPSNPAQVRVVWSHAGRICLRRSGDGGKTWAAREDTLARADPYALTQPNVVVLGSRTVVGWNGYIDRDAAWQVINARADG